MKALRPLSVVPLLLGLCACGGAPYDPPIRADHNSATYKADLEQCRKSSAASVHQHNAGTPGRWIISPITGPSQVRAAIRKCMIGKSYVLETPAG